MANKHLLDETGKRAIELIKKGESFFITGKAGTGKTTLLREAVDALRSLHKKVAVTASTGVAANNAGGVTLHSLLKIPLSPYVPKVKNKELYSLKEEERRVILSLDTLIIDEVSMVRCDVLDAVNDILRHYRKSELPFGGLQVILFGDLYQLMPVAKEDDLEKLSPIYQSMYFFSSLVMKKWNCPVLELKHVYRQSNPLFVNMLNQIREGLLPTEEERRLLSLYKPDFEYPNPNNYITLTTHKWMAEHRNNAELEAITCEDEVEYKAYIEGFYPRDDNPTNYRLCLKKGARVMFVKNDNKGNEYYNGKLGTVERLYDDCIVVRSDDDKKLINVERQRWDYQRYYINKKTKEMEIETLGSFIQFPLKLAWAITIHKSQGLTFDKVVIDAGRAFAPGQVYVALSRCRSLEGIVLLSRIRKKLLGIDETVVDYLNSAPKIEVAPEKPRNEKPLNSKRNRKVPESYAKTLKLIQKGISVFGVAQMRKMTMSTIFEHICFFVERGELSMESYVLEKNVRLIRSIIEELGDFRLAPIKARCPDSISYDEIKLVVADMKRELHEGELDETEEDDENNSEWYFVDSVPFKQTSKYFLSYACRVVLSTLGYYLEVNDEYIKLGNYPEGLSANEGCLWVKKPEDDRGWRVIHKTDNETFFVGYVKEAEKSIVFRNPDGEVFRIDFVENE